MKRNLLITIILALALSLALISCGGGDCTHIDDDNNLICDECGVSLEDGGEEEAPPECQHSDIDGNLLCDECGTAVSESLHIHDHSQKIVAAEFMVAGATCKSGAKYHFSCLCGDEGSEIFVDGEPLVYHSVNNGKCDVCGALECTRGLALSLNDDGKSYTVTGRGECTASEVNIGIYNSFSVTEIAPNAFKNSFMLERVTISNTVRVIGESAFENCTSLESISIPDSVATVGSLAFFSCYNINCVFITDIGAWCGISFEGSLANPLVYGSTLYLGGEPVADLVIPDGTVKIGNNAFCGYSSLESVSIPNSVRSVGAGAFGDCDSLVYNEYDNAYYLGNESNPYLLLVSAKSTDITSCTINESTKIIHSNAFANCRDLSGVVIPDSVTEIGMAAFYNCTSLSSVKISGSVTEIADSLFDGCSALAAVIIPDGIGEIGDSAFFGCASLSDINIPGSVTRIGSYAFAECASLAGISIPDSVRKFGEFVFMGCASLQYNEYDNAYYLGNASAPYLILIKAKSTDITSCNVNGGTKYIMSEAFYGLEALVSVTLPDGLVEIGDRAFEGATSLVEITIPSTVTSVGKRAFLNCRALVSINVAAENNVYRSEDGVLYSKDGSTLIQYPIGKSDVSFTVPTSVTVLSELSFAYAESLESLTLHDGIIKVEYGAFLLCEIKHITAPMDLISKISTDSLVSVVITSGNKIPSYAFSGCTDLVSVTISKSVYEIGDGAFSGCASLAGITIPDGVTKIGASAFSGCTSLRSATFEVTDGWWYTYYSSELSGTDIPKAELQDPATAAQHLLITNAYQYLKRSSYSILDKLPF